MTGTDNPGRRNGKPADVDDRHAMQSYVDRAQRYRDGLRELAE